MAIVGFIVIFIRVLKGQAQTLSNPRNHCTLVFAYNFYKGCTVVSLKSLVLVLPSLRKLELPEGGDTAEGLTDTTLLSELEGRGVSALIQYLLTSTPCLYMRQDRF